MSSSEQQTQSQTVTQPWSVQQPYLEQAFSGASGALNSAQTNGVAPTQFQAGLTPDQQATFNSMVNYGSTNGSATAQQTAGNGAIATGQGATGTAAGNMSSFDPSAT